MARKKDKNWTETDDMRDNNKRLIYMSEYSLEGLRLKPKLQHFGHLMWTADSLEKSLMLGKIEGRRRRGCHRMRWRDGIIDAMDMNLGKLWEMVRDREAWLTAAHGITKSRTQQGDWTTTKASEEKQREDRKEKYIFEERMAEIFPIKVAVYTSREPKLLWNKTSTLWV